MDPMQELAEIEVIKNLRIQYSHYFDGQHVDALADLFTEDAVCEFGPDYGGDWVGKAQIREPISSSGPWARATPTASCTRSPTR